MFRMVLFGVPHLYVGTKDLSKVITGRSLALLVYLAVTGKAQDRAVLADLLWDNHAEAQAKKNLRYVLYDLRQALGDYLLVSRQRIAFNHKSNYWLDVEVFSSYLRTEGPEANIELYQEVLDLHQGDFLHGFYIQDAPIFEEWLTVRRQQLHTQAIHGLHLLTQAYLAQHEYEKGLQITQRLLTLEPWNEEAHRQQMRLLACSGRRSAALAQYEVCRRALVAEYSAEPLIETTQLYEEIKAGRLNNLSGRKRAPHLLPSSTSASTTQPAMTQAELAVKAVAEASSAIQVNWDAIPIPPRLFGRTQEVAHLEQWICVEGCRLLSLTGLGGQGKSALSAEIVRRLADRAEDQNPGRQRTPVAQLTTPSDAFKAIFWCSLAGIASFSQLIAYWWRWCGASAALTDLESTPLEEQFAHLLLYLRQQRCLLVLDQVETVLQPGLFTGAYRPDWDYFPELLRRVAVSEHQSCLLIISREELPEFTYLTRNTSAVRTYALQGLSTPDSVAMLRSYGFAGEDGVLVDLAQRYAELPAALTCIGTMYQRIPWDQLSTLLVRDTPLFDELSKLFVQQCKRLSLPENELLLWLTIEQTTVSFEYFWQTFIGFSANSQILDAYQSLLRRSLLQFEPASHAIKLPTLVRRYTMQSLTDGIVDELVMAWHSTPQSSAVLPTKVPPYDVTAEQSSATRFAATSALAALDAPFAFYPGYYPEQPPILLDSRLAEPRVLQHAKNNLERERPSFSFALLRQYRLVNPNATALMAERQTNCILFPIIRGLHSRWGVRVTQSRLQALLFTLVHHNFEMDMTIVEYNLQRLLACLEFTEIAL